MIHGQRHKFINFAASGAIATDATSAVTVDTAGEDYCRIDAVISPATATNSSTKWTSLKLMHGTTTDVSNCTNIVGAVGTTNATATSSQFVLGVHNDTTIGGVTSFFVDLTNKEDILRLEVQATDSHDTVHYNITYFRQRDMDYTAAQVGSSAVVFV